MRRKPIYITVFLLILITLLVLSTSTSGSRKGGPGPGSTSTNVVGSGESNLKSSQQKKTCSFTNGLYANLLRFITKEGFHRDLGDTLEITVTSSSIPLANFVNGQCAFILYSEFTQDVYVDPYEISRDPLLSSHVRVLNNWTDLENPAWLAKSNSSVFVQVKTVQTGNLISSVEVKLPIHFRYQKPMSHSLNTKYKELRAEEQANTGGYYPVNLPLPKLLLRCSTWNPKLVQDLCDTVKLVCSLKSPMTKQCTWAVVPFNANSKGSTVFIPVGDSDLQDLITNSTFVVIICGTFFLLVTLYQAHKENSLIKPHAHMN